MKKNYVYLLILLLATIAITLLLSAIYRSEVKIEKTSYAYANLNKITSTEFDEYIIEHPDTIIYISDKNNLDNNKFEKKLIKKLENMNLLENVIYIEKEDINDSLEKKLKEQYSYEFNEEKLPFIIVLNDSEVIQTSMIDEFSSVETIIDYEAFK